MSTGQRAVLAWTLCSGLHLGLGFSLNGGTSTRLHPPQIRHELPSTACRGLAQGSFDKPEIVQDIKPKWYILNVANGKELLSKKLLDKLVDNMNLRSEVLDVYVPTEATSVTMGKKVKHHERALYPSYTFIHMIMGPAAHAALLSSEHVINFVGRDRGQLNKSGGGLTGARGFVEPLPLTPQEIDQFQLEAKKYGLDSVPDPTLGFTIGDMVEIVEGAYKGERGPIRLVRNGGVTVRLFAYGQWFDLDFKPKMVKVLFNHDFAVPAVPTPAQSLRKQPLSPEEQERANARAYVKKQRFEEREAAKAKQGLLSRLSAIGLASDSDGNDDGIEEDRQGNYGDVSAEAKAAMDAQEEEQKGLEAAEENFLDALFAQMDDKEVEETLEAFGIGEDGAQEDKDAGDIDEVDLESLTAVQLKDRCRDLGLKVGGTKAVLLERLRSAWISQIPK